MMACCSSGTTREGISSSARLKKTQDDVDAGRLDVLQLYRAASGIFKAEQEAADGQMLARRDVGR
jgi:hypothetical protein